MARNSRYQKSMSLKLRIYAFSSLLTFFIPPLLSQLSEDKAQENDFFIIKAIAKIANFLAKNDHQEKLWIVNENTLQCQPLPYTLLEWKNLESKNFSSRFCPLEEIGDGQYLSTCLAHSNSIGKIGHNLITSKKILGEGQRSCLKASNTWSTMKRILLRVKDKGFLQDLCFYFADHRLMRLLMR